MLVQVRRDKLAAEGKTLGESEAAAIRAPVIAQYERQGHPHYASARLWDDGVIDPAQSRTVLALALAAARGRAWPQAVRHLPDVRSSYVRPALQRSLAHFRL